MARSNRLKTLEVVNGETGEIRQLDVDEWSFIAVRERSRCRQEFTMFFQDSLAELAKDRELWGRPRAVLDYLASRLNYENYIAVPQVEIAEALDMNKQNVNAAIKVLLRKGILVPGPKLGHTCSYRLNSQWGWRGKLRNLPERRREEIVEATTRMVETTKAQQIGLDGGLYPHQNPS